HVWNQYYYDPDDLNQSNNQNDQGRLHLGLSPPRRLYQQRIYLPRAQPMNFSAAITDRGLPCPRGISAYTLVETMMAAALFSLVLVAVLGCHIGGLKLNENVRPKVENSRYARETLSPLIEEVRSANSIQVGTGTTNLTNFSAAAASQPQTGNALK